MKPIHPFGLLAKLTVGAMTTCALMSSGLVRAQTAPVAPAPYTPPPLTDFFKRAAYTSLLPSPDGRYLATTAESNGRMNVVLIDLVERKATSLSNYNNIDVGNVHWAGNHHVLFSAIQLNAPTGQDSPRAGGLFAAAVDGSGITQLAKTARQLARSETGGFAFMQFMRMVEGNKDEMIAAALTGGDNSVDLFRVNLINGRYRILTQGRPDDRIQNWILDSKSVPRVAIARKRGTSTEQVVHYRASADAPWSILATFDETAPPAFVPLAFDSDDLHLYVATNEGRKNMAIVRYNPETKKSVEVVAQHPKYDLGASPAGDGLNSLIFSGDANGGKLLGFKVDADRPQTVWIDDRMAKIQATLDASLKGRTNFVRRTEGNKFAVFSFSDTSPGRFFIYDEEKRRIEEIGASRPWLENKLASVTPFMLKTRDGLEIPSYYVLPKNHQAGQRLPTVVHIHGGPMGRDVVLGGLYGASFGINEAQLLASRGYAVVLPNFRVTPELGSDIYYAGFGKYGKEMSDDHEDAAKWAVDQGFADAKRICISGASYGGYAAMFAVTRPSNPFACAISGLPVTDLKFQRSNADYASSPSAVEYWRKLQGVKNWDDPLVTEASPVTHAGRIKVPVFMYIGDEDERTPPKQAYQMAEALKQAGNPVKDFYVGKGEGHGYGVIKTNVELYERMLAFLQKSIGP